MSKDGTSLSNLVTQDKLRDIQLRTLEEINNVISKSAGPFGAYTMVMNDQRLTEYTKDGKKILDNFKFFRPLERSVLEELKGITEHVVVKVGDGTTGAIQLSYLIFKALVEESDKFESSPYIIMEKFQEVTAEIVKRIKDNARELTLDDIKEICLISTNGNETVSEEIASIYKQFGRNVYIQWGTSNTENSITKIYDGIIMNKGYASRSFINNERNECEIYNPRIYYFPDPVDTPEMIQLFVKIFTQNIYIPYQQQHYDQFVPTIIMVPGISKDLESTLQDIDEIFFAFDTAKQLKNKPPFCVITGINSNIDNIGDIVTLCDCPLIKRYINPDQREEDVKNGLAPTIDNVTEFYGSADIVTIDSEKMKIINPKRMFEEGSVPDENGVRPTSNTYNALVAFLHREIKAREEEKLDLKTLFSLRKRLHCLLANFVEYNVGGISAADRDSVRDLVEDAILNCRSAVVDGVGYGASFNGFLAARSLLMESTKDSDDYEKTYICKIIYDAYTTIILNLYKTAMPETQAREILDQSIDKGKPYNLRDKSFDKHQVLCSVNTDISILNAISRIITLMYTANQALLSDPTQNYYLND